jgi:hypothetical protein
MNIIRNLYFTKTQVEFDGVLTDENIAIVIITFI